ncbi:MAG TPA: potassium/proton antiporter [Burkholderiaceae bacterium]|nr:potassium/proton antiporter [Burkholderiaceae bacterium]
MEEISHALLVASLLLFAAIALTAVSQRLGVPSLLVFLAVGLVATELPGAPRVSIPVATAALIGNLALAIILLDGGLRTRVGTLRMVAGPALSLATLGVFVTAAIVGASAVALLGLDWRYGLLLGAIVGSTDAAAVFALLGGGGLRLNERVEATLEVESGLNDPMAVFLTIATIELIRVPGSGFATLAPMFVQQLLVGLAVGWGLGRLLGRVVARIRLGEGLYVLLIQSGGLAVFAVANVLGGSGFLAIYLAGMIVANQRRHVTVDVLRVSDGFAWLAQATMFLLLGVITDIAELSTVVTGKVLIIALALMLLARPLAAAICLFPFRYPGREVAFIGWVGMRGAVPIVLALFPLLAGLPQASLLFHIAFLITLLSLLLQGSTLSAAARLAGVQRPQGSMALSSATLEGGEPPREVVQFRVAEASQAAIGPAADIAWPEQVRIVEVCRDDRIVAAQRLRAADLVTVVAPEAALAELEVLFGPPAPVGELSIDPAASVGDLFDYYGAPVPADAGRDMKLTEFVSRRLRKRGAAGDLMDAGGLKLTVRQASFGVVRRVGLRLSPPSGP